jgi:putative spermidine/putrescine transport system substrate-binding protein
MMSAKAQHPNCAYKWMQYITQPKPQAQQAIYFGETPVNKKACPIMNALSKGSCAQYQANAPESFYRSIKFWKTPVAECGNGQKNCTDLRAWTTAWQQVKG